MSKCEHDWFKTSSFLIDRCRKCGTKREKAVAELELQNNIHTMNASADVALPNMREQILIGNQMIYKDEIEKQIKENIGFYPCLYELGS